MENTKKQIKRYIIFDSSTLINMITNGLFDIIIKLKKIFPGEFLITPAVEYETVEHPKKIQRFEWGALRIEELINLGILKRIDNIIDKSELKRQTQGIMRIANNTFFSANQPISIIEAGESECLALSLMLNKNGIQNLTAIDERTARLVIENPENLRKLFRQKLHTDIQIRQNLDYLKQIRIIRSTELAYVAMKKGLLIIHDKDALEAVLYALKFGGASITDREIQVTKRL